VDTLRKSGGWCVELTVPIKHGNRVIEEIDIKAPSIRTLTRWQRGQIPSSMALLSELSGISESVLDTITYPDADRVLLALFNVVPKPIQSDFSSGTRPLSTPVEELPEPAPGTRPVAQDDPRFPYHDGPVVESAVGNVSVSRPPGTEPPPEEEAPVKPLNFDPPPVMRKVV
jgi:hypothetical protein